MQKTPFLISVLLCTAALSSTSYANAQSIIYNTPIWAPPYFPDVCGGYSDEWSANCYRDSDGNMHDTRTGNVYDSEGNLLGVGSAPTEQPQSESYIPETNSTAHDLWLMNGSTQVLTGQFYANETIFGVCDGDCSDLDINLYDSNGALVSSDTLLDALPIVTAPYDGIFNVEVIMTTCTHSSGCQAQVDSDYGF
jgi:hypothetical protein